MLVSCYKGLRLVLEVQCVTKSTQRRFLYRFAERRMRVDGAGNVFQSGAHLQALTERRRQFRHSHADRLPADNHMIVTPRHDLSLIHI